MHHHDFDTQTPPALFTQMNTYEVIFFFTGAEDKTTSVPL